MAMGLCLATIAGCASGPEEQETQPPAVAPEQPVDATGSGAADDEGPRGLTPLQLSLWEGGQLFDRRRSVLGARLALLGSRNHDMLGLDASAFSSRLDGSLTGLQVSGFASSVHGNVLGIQASAMAGNRAGALGEEGLSQENRVIGAQIGLLANFGNVTGLQVALLNGVGASEEGGDFRSAFLGPALGVSREEVASHRYAGFLVGLQVGLGNVATDMVGGQLGLFNDADSMGVLQAGVFRNRAGGGSGLQVSLANDVGRFAGIQLGLVDLADHVTGFQVGAWNGRYGGDKTTVDGAQLGGINMANDITGVQLAAINISDLGTGMQLGAWNVTEIFHGLQIGLINSATDLNGIQIGLWNVNLAGLFTGWPVINWSLTLPGG